MRTKRAALSFGTGALFSGMTVLMGLVATPLLLHWLGEERFGAYRAATDWYGHLTLLELGLGGALLPLIAAAVGRGDFQAVRNTLAVGVRAFAWVSLAVLAVGVALASVITGLVPVDGFVAEDLRRGCLVVLLGTLMLPFSPFRILCEACQRGYLVHVLLLFQSLLVTSLSLLLAWAGWGITGQFAGVVLGGIPLYLILTSAGLRRYPGVLGLALRGTPASTVPGELRKLNGPTFVMNLSGRISLMTDNIIVAGFLGPVIVVPFFLTQRLALLVQGQLQGIGNASWAALAELHVQGQHDVFSRRIIELTSLVAVLGVAGLAPIVAFNQHFVSLWVGGDRFGGHLITVVAALNAYLLAVFSLWGWCFTGTGRVRLLVPLLIATTTTNLVLSVVLTHVVGIVGPLLGTLFAFLTTNTWYFPILLHRTFGIPWRPLIRAVTLPLIWGLPYAGAVCWIAQSHQPDGWLGLGAEMALTTLGYLTLWWLLALTPSQRGTLVERARMVFQRSEH